MFRVIKGEKIRAQRGKRSLQDVALASGGQFTRAALSQWENGVWKPKDDNIPVLLAALGCNYEDITEPVETAIPIQKSIALEA